VFFEAPHRVSKTLQELSLLIDRPIFSARELTKVHEELIWGTPAELSARFDAPLGEFTLIVPPGVAVNDVLERPTDEQIREIFGEMTKLNGGGTKREVARRVAESLGLSTKDVYNALERAKIGQ
jgi:16S rRNA (cytidine1402-2'-O)-methyltransferase